MDADRQFFTSAVGLPEPLASQRQTPLTHSFCQHAVAACAPLVLGDARDVPLVRDNLAIPALGVVAYAGIPLLTADGCAVGTLCVIDTQPRAWTATEIEVLEDLATAAMAELDRHACGRLRVGCSDPSAGGVSLHPMAPRALPGGRVTPARVPAGTAVPTVGCSQPK